MNRVVFKQPGKAAWAYQASAEASRSSLRVLQPLLVRRLVEQPKEPPSRLRPAIQLDHELLPAAWESRLKSRADVHEGGMALGKTRKVSMSAWWELRLAVPDAFGCPPCASPAPCETATGEP